MFVGIVAGITFFSTKNNQQKTKRKLRIRNAGGTIRKTEKNQKAYNDKLQLHKLKLKPWNMSRRRRRRRRSHLAIPITTRTRTGTSSSHLASIGQRCRLLTPTPPANNSGLRRRRSRWNIRRLLIPNQCPVNICKPRMLLNLICSRHRPKSLTRRFNITEKENACSNVTSKLRSGIRGEARSSRKEIGSDRRSDDSYAAAIERSGETCYRVERGIKSAESQS